MSLNPPRVTLHIEAETMPELISAASHLCQGHAKAPDAKLQESSRSQLARASRSTAIWSLIERRVLCGRARMSPVAR